VPELAAVDAGEVLGRFRRRQQPTRARPTAGFSLILARAISSASTMRL